MKRRAALFALGCRLNQAEAGLLADQLRTAGFEIVPWGGPAELLVVNSCTVTAAAAAKTRNIVRAARKRCPGAFLALTGCDATIAADAWAADNAAVDLILSNADKHTLPERLPAALFPTAQLPPAPGGTPGGSGRDAHAPVETDRRQHHLQHRAGRPAKAGGTPTLPWKPPDRLTARPSPCRGPPGSPTASAPT